MTASSVASVKVEREQIEQLARVLRVDLRLQESGAALFRRCLERASELATQDTLDRLDRATGRARVVIVEAETDNAGALDALGVFQRALGGLGEADATADTERPPAAPRGA